MEQDTLNSSPFPPRSIRDRSSADTAPFPVALPPFWGPSFGKRARVKTGKYRAIIVWPKQKMASFVRMHVEACRE